MVDAAESPNLIRNLVRDVNEHWQKWTINRLALASKDEFECKPLTRIVGIDLGTTNSLVAYMQGDTPVVIPGEDGSNCAVGGGARRERIRSSSATPRARSDRNARARRLFGQAPDGPRLEDIQDELKLFPFRLADDVQARRSAPHHSSATTIHSAGNFGAHSAPAQAQRRAFLRRSRLPRR